MMKCRNYIIVLLLIIFQLLSIGCFAQTDPLESRIKRMHLDIGAFVQGGGDIELVKTKIENLTQLFKQGDRTKIEEAVAEIEKIVAQPKSTCIAVTEDLEYECPSSEIDKSHDVLLSQFRILYTAKIDGSGEKAPVLPAPDGWGIYQNSISPDHKRVLLIMKKEACPADFPNSAGRLCSWGRNVLWMVERNSDKWVLKNLASIYGFNADIHEWTNWLSNSHALFNGVIRDEAKPVLGNSQEENNAKARQIRIDSDGEVNIGVWGTETLNGKTCLIGRLSSNRRNNSNSCSIGTKVIFAKRCYDDDAGDKNFSWWNTKTTDGKGKCDAASPSARVPVLRVYSVEVDEMCQPKEDLSEARPVKTPWHTGLFRHMSKSMAEWGDMQPAISLDGRTAAFMTVRGYEDSHPDDNCGSFRHDGRGATRIYYCMLSKEGVCLKTELASKPDDLKTSQGMPMFVGGAILMVEGSPNNPANVIKVENGKRTTLFTGIGGYPLR